MLHRISRLLATLAPALILSLGASSAHADFNYRVTVSGLTAAPGTPAAPVVPSDPVFAKVTALFHLDGSLPAAPVAAPTNLAYGTGRFDQALNLEANTPGAMRVTGLTFSQPAIGIQDFTLEGWLKPKSFSAEGVDTLITGPSYDTLLFRPTTRSDALYVGGAACGTFAAGTWVAGTWAHFAIVRSGSTVFVFKDGTLVKTCSGAGANIPAGTWRVGSREGFSEAYSGMLDDLRLTIGNARYLVGFTPPSAPAPDQ